MKNLEVIILTKLDLKDAVAKNKYWNGTIQPPFSKNKAKWMLENNRADNGDPLAVLGYEGHVIVAFVCLVPDLIKADGGAQKIFWSQVWWVADKYKDTVLSTYVKKQSLEACNNQVIVKFLGDNTKSYYQKQPFIEFSKRKRHIILFSLDYDLLTYKKASLKKIAPILKLTDGISRRIIAIINKRKAGIKNNALTYKSISLIDDATWKFLEAQCTNDAIPKSKAYINWQISNAQYHVFTNDNDKPDYKCLLRSISKKKHNSNVVIKHHGKIVGFISGLVAVDRFTLRYFVCDKAFYNNCLNVLIKVLIDAKCVVLQTENSELSNSIKERYFSVYNNAKTLTSLICNGVRVNHENLSITDKEGNFF